ncbi:putative BRCT domain-containing protein [Dioscorea sansibarensis]
MSGCSVEVIESRSCSRLFVGSSTPGRSPYNRKSNTSMALTSPAQQQPSAPGDLGPFAGLVICVTGLSKEARKQVMVATERLGGQYSASLHPHCTHLVFEHALKHGSRNGLLIVSLGWFVDSVRRTISESLYSVRSVEENGLPLRELSRLVGYTSAENSCLPVVDFGDTKPSNTALQAHLQTPRKEVNSTAPVLSKVFIYIDPNISSEMNKKVVDAAAREGANFLNHWFAGCHATHVVCEGLSVQSYMGHAGYLITPVWILKTVKEKHVQRLVHLSCDLARQVSLLLENVQINLPGQGMDRSATNTTSPTCQVNKDSLIERQNIVDMAKQGVRTRRNRRMQLCQVPLHPFTPSSLLDSICWSVSEPTTSACIYTESSETEESSRQHSPVFLDARDDDDGDGRNSNTSFDNFSRLLRESDKREVILKSHFLTILFPIDRFGELGPSARTFFSDGGFMCLQVLDMIYIVIRKENLSKTWDSENMSADEIAVAIHTDSRHADRLRSLYASKESVDLDVVPFKRIDFLGSRRNFESLKRVGGENNGNVYELLIRA